MDFIFGVLFGWLVAGVIYFLWIHGKLAGIEQRIIAAVESALDKVKRGVHP